MGRDLPFVKAEEQSNDLVKKAIKDEIERQRLHQLMLDQKEKRRAHARQTSTNLLTKVSEEKNATASKGKKVD